MRPLEISLVALIAIAALWLSAGRARRTGRLLAGGAVAVAAAHAILEGAHWQMIPAYAALGILCLLAWKPDGARLRPILLAWTSLIFAAGSIGLSYMLPMFQLPKPTGQYQVGTRILYFKDASRVEDAAPVAGTPRELMVQLWYPAEESGDRLAHYREPRETNAISSYQSVLRTNSRLDAPVSVSGGPYPVLLLNPSWGGRRTNYTYLAEDLASHGYLVASIDHTYNASLVAFPDGRVIRGRSAAEFDYMANSTPERVQAVWNQELLKSAADDRFILDQLAAANKSPGTPWYGRVNTDVAGAIGHSFGGAVATETCDQDRRVRASVNMDGWFFGAIHARGTNQPLLIVSESFDAATLESAPASADLGMVLDKTDFEDVKASLRQFGGYRLAVDGTAHNDFSDQPLVSPLRSISHRGSMPAPEIQRIVRAYVLAFFDKTLRGEDSEILRAHLPPFQHVSFEVWPDRKIDLVSSRVGSGR
jgi:predicted dienelactone hydrolase